MSDIITRADAKTILNISGTSQDALIDIHLETVQELLYQILGIQSILTHTVTRELTKIYDCEYFYLEEFPVTAVSNIFVPDTHEEITDFSFSIDPKNNRKIFLVDSSGVPKFTGYEEIKVTYTAGYANYAAVPNSLKTVAAYMIGGLLAENKKMGGVEEYRVGSKMVKFSDEAQARTAMTIIRSYLANYKPPIVVS
jgi:hypothetical protein